MRALGFDVKKPDVIKLVHDVDPNNSGSIDYEQFLEISKLLRYLCMFFRICIGIFQFVYMCCAVFNFTPILFSCCISD